MTDFEKLLNQVVQGKSNLAPVRAWLDQNLSKPGCNHATLLTALQAAESNGLSEPVVQAIRTHIESAAPPPSDFPFELDEAPAKPAEKTQKVAKTQVMPKASPEKTQMMNPAAAEKTQLTSGSESTRPAMDRTATAPGDRTTVQTPTGRGGGAGVETDQGRTVITQSGATEDPTSRSGGKRGVETDPFALDSTPASKSSTTTGTSWRTSTGLKSSGGGDNLGPGSVLKERFELMDVLGEGGMGKVYKARDLLKVEAKDKNPYIAVKTLTGDFKQHPESFIALQRESSKAQRLAHPNIATVYDFDRDGGTVYMTMELMEGDELAKYIKHLPAGGLPVPEAMHIIKQLCDGLAYAHSKQLVHSDFKPGNAFLTKDGTVKLLDFGIARASKTRKDAGGETTVFDPGQLGALTPAYATVEMFEGMDPDQRDDIYALACVAYELLTGKHPFNKLSAPKVLEKGLRPSPIVKLTKTQNRALMRGLALRREERIGTVEEFWDGIRPRKSRTKQIVAGSIAAVVFLTLALYTPIITAVHNSRNKEIIAQINTGKVNIPDTVKLVWDTFDDNSKNAILNGEAKNTIIGYFKGVAAADTDETKGQYNYQAALDAIKTASTYYSDSAELQQAQSNLKSSQATLINELNGQFNSYMTAGKLMPGNGPNITDTIRVLRVADPQNSMLKDARLANRYAGMVQSSVNDKDYQTAGNVLKVGLDYAPNDSSLLNLQDQVKRELKRQADAQVIAGLETKLKDAAPGLKSLADFDKVRDDIYKLHTLNPGDPVVQRLNDPLKAALQSALNSASSQKRWDDAEKDLFNYSHLLALSDLLAERQSLTATEVSASYVPADMKGRLDEVTKRRNAIQSMLDAPKANDPDWDASLLGLYQETTARLQSNDMQWYGELRDNVAKTYIKLSQQMMQASRFDAATNLLATGKSYSPQLADFAQADQALATAQDAFNKAQAEKLRVAQIDASKTTFQSQLNAGQMDAATQTYNTLKQSLPANDAFFTDTAPKAYANAYLNLARGRAVNNDFRAAVKFAQAGLQYAPLDDLKKALQEYSGQVSKSDLLAMVDNLQTSGMGDLKAKLAAVQGQFPQQQVAIADGLTKKLASHIDGLKDTDQGLAYDLMNAAKTAFPDSAVIQNLKIAPPARPSKFAALGRDAMKANNLTKAQGDLDQGNQQEAGNQDLAQFGTSLQNAQASATRYFVAYQQYMQAGQTQQAQAYLSEALRQWADNPAWLSEYKRNFATTVKPAQSSNGGRACTADLATYGRSGRGECFDVLDGTIHGPTMVVVPAGGAVTTAFAIGKYEVSVGEFDAFCKSSGQCSPLPGDTEMPAVNVSYNDAKAYVAWLSQKSGTHYYIPSVDQWQYAASAGGTDTNRNFNCHVELGGQVIKGLSIVTVQTGQQNAWGLVNALGNVQQYVASGGGAQAAGGDYQDPLSDCTTSLLRPTSGSADPLTGLRVARDINQ